MRSEYDATLKEVLTDLTGAALRLLTRASEAVLRWSNVELSGVRKPRVDLLGETAGGGLLHIELQSANDPNMAVRMLEYALAVRRSHGRFPDQVVLYVGREPMRMPDTLEGPGLRFHYRLIDVGAIDGEALLESPRLEDNVIAILTRLRDPRAAVRRILARIAASPPGDRERALDELGTLAGLRQLGTIIDEEAAAMPITESILDHDLFGPTIREGIAIGTKQGLEKARLEGRVEGERETVRRQIEKRFGRLPAWANKRLISLTEPDIEDVALRVLDAPNLKAVFGHKSGK